MRATVAIAEVGVAVDAPADARTPAAGVAGGGGVREVDGAEAGGSLVGELRGRAPTSVERIVGAERAGCSGWGVGGRGRRRGSASKGGGDLL